MLTIRLTRKGKKNQPFFRVVVVDKKRSAKRGRAVEILGYVDPLTKKKSFKKDRVLHWLKCGAQPSPTIHNLLVSEKIIDAKKIAKHKKSKNPPALKATEGQGPAEATPVASAAEPTPEIPAPQTPTQPTEAPKAPASTESSGEAKEEKPAK